MPVLENARQERFCQALVRGLPAVRAYVAAGYAPDDGHAARLAENGRVVERLAELQSEAARVACITRASILDRLNKLADRCMQAEPVMENGLETGEYKFNAQGAHAALKTLGEMIPDEGAADGGGIAYSGPRLVKDDAARQEAERRVSAARGEK
jgi:phage terminase small subunit